MKKVFIGLVLLSVLFFVGASVSKNAIRVEESPNVQLIASDLPFDLLELSQTAEMSSKTMITQFYCRSEYGGCSYSGMCCTYINCPEADYCCPMCGKMEPAWNVSYMWAPGPCPMDW